MLQFTFPFIASWDLGYSPYNPNLTLVATLKRVQVPGTPREYPFTKCTIFLSTRTVIPLKSIGKPYEPVLAVSCDIALVMSFAVLLVTGLLNEGCLVEEIAWYEPQKLALASDTIFEAETLVEEMQGRAAASCILTVADAPISIK